MNLNPLKKNTILRAELSGRTDKGMVRDINQDAFVVLKGKSVPRWAVAVAGVFDGVGGLPHGEESSARAVRYLQEALILPDLRRGNDRNPERTIKQLLIELHEKIVADGMVYTNLEGMATTATLAIVERSRPVVWIGSVGDSPAFRLGNGKLEKLTQDDTYVEQLVRKGVITQEEAEQHPQRHVITQALGFGSSVEPHVRGHGVTEGDLILLATDGLTNLVSLESMAEILQGDNLEKICMELIDAANTVGGPDNITSVVMRFAFSD